MGSNFKTKEQEQIELLVTHGLGYNRSPKKIIDSYITLNLKNAIIKLEELRLQVHLGNLELKTTEHPSLELKNQCRDVKNRFSEMYDKLMKRGESINENRLKNYSFAQSYIRE